MPSFKAPQYTKAINPKTGVQEPCYTFSIDYESNEEGITFVADSSTDITLHTLQKCILDSIEWWNIFINAYLQASSKFFTKQYTVEHINKLTKHTLSGNVQFETPVTVILLPKTIQIIGGAFIVNWTYTVKPVVIDIPDLESEKDNIELVDLPDSNKIIDGMEELNIDEIPVGTNSTDGALKLDSPTKFYDKQRVKEARLKAKLAVYKAQRQMAQYYEKYGDDISDSDSESETSDEDNDEDLTEEVQF